MPAKVDMEQLASSAEEHLRNPYMAGKPHIGVLGPEPDTGPSDGEDTGVTLDTDDQSPDSDSQDRDFDPEWRFVPNKAVCAARVKSASSGPIEARVRFAIRVREGCQDDIDDPAIAGERHPDGKLSTDDVRQTIRYYDVTLTTRGPGSGVQVKVVQDREQIKDFVVEEHDSPDEQECEVKVVDRSEPFITYVTGKRQLTHQDYLVRITQSIQKASDGTLTLTLTVLNQSPWTAMSRLPDMKFLEDERDAKGGRHETRNEAFARLAKDTRVPEGWQPPLWEKAQKDDNPSGNNYGYLMDFEARIHVESSVDPYGELEAGRTVNVIGTWSGTSSPWNGDLVFRDSAVFREHIPKMAAGRSPEDVLGGFGMHEDLIGVFRDAKKWPTLYRFQELAITKIHRAITQRDHDAVLISARTAGGKTEAFGIPVINHCIQRAEERGVKALIFYPTKALSNDQANRFIELLYHLNERRQSREERSITLGIIHGDVARDDPESDEDATDLPLACCRIIAGSPCPGRLTTHGHEATLCDQCGHEYDFLRLYSRRSSYSDPPDILVTNPDTITWDLQVRPFNHSIFGRPAWVCRYCRATFIARGAKRNCPTCSKKDCMEEIRPCTPDLIIFDEVHLVKGAFGINTSLFLSRLLAMLRRYEARYHGNENHHVTLIGSTATISEPVEFGREFFNVGAERLAVVPSTSEERESLYEQETDVKQHRYHLAMLPYAYQGDSTVAKTVHYLEANAFAGEPPVRIRNGQTGLVTPSTAMGGPLQLLCFVNNIRTSNNLISITQRGLAAAGVNAKIDGHTTDFDKKQRADTERAFNRCDTNVLFATSTLEVGVDFRRVDGVIAYGMPYSFNDYLQRIGRTGRSGDGLVVTVCQNWRPVDHYYFSNLEKQLADPTSSMEPVPLTRTNAEAHKRGAKAASMDFLASHEAASDWIDDVRKMPLNGPVSAADLVDYALEVLQSPEKYRDEVAAEVTSFHGELLNNAVGRLQPQKLMTFFMDGLNEDHQLTNLRSTDRQVAVEIHW